MSKGRVSLILPIFNKSPGLVGRLKAYFKPLLRAVLKLILKKIKKSSSEMQGYFCLGSAKAVFFSGKVEYLRISFFSEKNLAYANNYSFASLKAYISILEPQGQEAMQKAIRFLLSAITKRDIRSIKSLLENKTFGPKNFGANI